MSIKRIMAEHIRDENSTGIDSIYLDWVNNFLTLECFAEYYAITLDQAYDIVTWGRLYHP